MSTEENAPHVANKIIAQVQEERDSYKRQCWAKDKRIAELELELRQIKEGSLSTTSSAG
jgi:hypothetical protein